MSQTCNFCWLERTTASALRLTAPLGNVIYVRYRSLSGNLLNLLNKKPLNGVIGSKVGHLNGVLSVVVSDDIIRKITTGQFIGLC